jgi:transposase-like protein
MPYSYPQDRPTVRQEIVGRIAAGERLKAICREAGMPCVESVRGWMRREPGFAAEVARARAKADWRRRGRFDVEAAMAALARLQAGETTTAILRDPAGPSRQAFARWRAASPGYDAKVRAAQAKLPRKRRRGFDAAIADRIYVRLWMGEPLRAVLRSDPAFPSLAVFARWRREDPEFDGMIGFVLGAWKTKRPGLRGPYSPELEEDILDGIVEGGSLRSLAQRADMPCARTLYNWVRRKPEFAAKVAQACEWREDWYFDQLLEITGARGAPVSQKEMRRRTAPLMNQLVRLRKRPGWKRARDGA